MTLVSLVSAAFTRLFRFAPGAKPRLLFLVALLLVGGHAPLGAATVPTGFADSVFAGGIPNPTAMAFAPDGRLFVCQQNGNLRVVKNGALLATPFLTVTVSSVGERGLLGIAFDPNFAVNNYVYVYYTATTPAIHNRVSRFTANGDVAVPGSETVLLDLDNLTGATNHNGGAMHFGADGKLFIAVGENATPSNAQTLNNLLGKMLRINADGTIPSDNPFYFTAVGRNRAIWALGLRNPFTFAFQPGTNRMFINDVGQNTWEEINDGFAGANYGWPTTEGPTTNPSFVGPVFAYRHDTGAFAGCAITGGTFYNPSVAQFPSEYTGSYFFADYCSNYIARYNPATNTTTAFATNAPAVVDLRVGPDGSLFYLARGSGGIVGRIRYTASQAPSIAQQPANVTVTEGQTATFTVSASGTPPFTYQWQKNGANIPGATAASYTTPPTTLADTGAQFRCVVSNAFGSATSNNATLTVTANRPPTATITAPTAGTQFSMGQTISYAGTASDPEDGTLPPSAFTWQVDFYGGAEGRPFIPPTSGASSGTFTLPTRLAYTEPDIFYRIILRVHDSGGLTTTVTRDILPRTATITLASSPAGLQVSLDGQPQPAPFTVTSVVGLERDLGTVSPQTVGGVTYAFVSWSDGGALTHTIATPASSTTYAATFRVVDVADNGYLDVADCDRIAGWAWDAEQPNAPIAVDLWIDGVLVTRVLANGYRPDVEAAGFGNGRHGFSFAPPAFLKDGASHTVDVRFAGTSRSLTGSPRVVQCAATNYLGYLDVADCGTLAGWAWDNRQPNTPISVDLFIDGVFHGRIAADGYRPDVQAAGFGDGRHGFRIPTPAAVLDGAPHTIEVRFAGTSTALIGSPRSVRCPTGGAFQPPTSRNQ